MHTDAREIPDNTLIEGDICIVGAGPAGLTIAMEWDNPPFKVILLEFGGFDYDDQVQDLYAGRTTGQTYYPLKSTRLHYFAGTSNRAQSVLDLGPYEYDVAWWQKQDPSLQSLFPASSDVWNKVWQFSPPTRFGKKYGDRIKRSKNIHLYTYANLTAIIANEPVSAINHLTVKNLAGKTHTVKAKRYIHSRVTLDTVKDALGMPRSVLHWELTPLEKRSIHTIYQLIGRQAGANGIARVQLMEYLQDPNDISWPDFTGGGWHHMGTTRMSDDPHTGVVDAEPQPLRSPKKRQNIKLLTTLFRYPLLQSVFCLKTVHFSVQNRTVLPQPNL